MASAHEYYPAHLALRVYAQCRRGFVIVFVYIMGQKPEPRGLYPLLQQLQYAGEEKVVPPAHYYRNAVGGKLLQVLCVAVRLVAVTLYHFHNAPAGILVHVRPLVQYARYGADTHA